MEKDIVLARRNVKEEIRKLRIGDRVLLTGTIYTARDAAHKEFMSIMEKGEEMPFEIRGAMIYYAGPTPGDERRPTLSCGPTTSCRMDSYAVSLYEKGLLGTIGKGDRSNAIQESIARNGAVYLCAVGGAGALIAQHIKSMEEIAFPELGCESVKRLMIERMPLIVGIDSSGGNLFEIGRRKYSSKTSD